MAQDEGSDGSDMSREVRIMIMVLLGWSPILKTGWWEDFRSRAVAAG